MQLDPGLEAVDPALAFRHFQLLKLEYDKLLSNFALKCNLKALHSGHVTIDFGAASSNPMYNMVGQQHVLVDPGLTPR